VTVLVRVLPFAAEGPDFALKGGVAVDLLARDMPDSSGTSISSAPVLLLEI